MIKEEKVKFNIKKILPSFFGTLILLLFIEIISTAVLPAIGIVNYKIPIDILVILFLGFRLETPFLAIFILFIQLFHSIFSVEGWAYGTFTGVIVCMVIGYVKDHLQFTSILSTMILTQLFQILWFVIVGLLFYFQTKEFSYIELRFFHFIPESVFLSLISPLVYAILDKFWSTSSTTEASI